MVNHYFFHPLEIEDSFPPGGCQPYFYFWHTLLDIKSAPAEGVAPHSDTDAYALVPALLVWC